MIEERGGVNITDSKLGEKGIIHAYGRMTKVGNTGSGYINIAV